MIAVDANVVAYLLIPGPLTALAQGVGRKDPGWVSPALCRSELMSICMGYVRRGSLTLAEAQGIVRGAVRHLGLPPQEVLPETVLALATSSACSSYDCEYVALAQTLGVPLVTADRQVLGAFPGTAVSMQDFLKG